MKSFRSAAMAALLLAPQALAPARALAQTMTRPQGMEGLGKELLKDRIQEGDVIAVNLFPGEEYSREVTVQPDGSITMPLIGVVQVRGLSVPELEILIQRKFSKYVANPQVTSNVRRFSGRRISIIGEVVRPGFYDYRDGMRLLELVSLAGGLTQDARPSRVKVLRADAKGSRSFAVNFKAVLDGDVSRDPLVAPGDTIHVPRQPFTVGAAWVNRNVLPWAVISSMIASVIIATKYH